LAFSGGRGGAISATGASADITHSDAEVAITPVLKRNFDFSSNVPPRRSIRL
jgi:hypothetical protein